jgi:hypothetical protein
MNTPQTQTPAGLMKLKEKILEVLHKRNFTYKALADYLHVTEQELDDAPRTARWRYARWS